MKLKKLVFSIAAAICIMLAMTTFSIAADREAGIPDVVVDGKKVEFVDQTAVIVDGRTLVPARGVFEAMNCLVEWDEAEFKVTVTSEAKSTVAELSIDSNVMKVTKGEDVKNVTLEVPAQLMNSRTMIPLRAVSEAMGCIVVWSDSAFAANISSGGMVSSKDFNDIVNAIMTGKRMTLEEAMEKGKMALTLHTDVEDVKAGDEVDFFVKLHNPLDGYKLTCVGLEMNFDKTQFEYISGSATLLTGTGEECDRDDATENTVHETGMRVISDDILGQDIAEDGYIFKLKLKALTDDGGEVSMANQFINGRGYTTSILLSEDCITDEIFEGNDLYVDTTAINLK